MGGSNLAHGQAN